MTLHARIGEFAETPLFFQSFLNMPLIYVFSCGRLPACSRCVLTADVTHDGSMHAASLALVINAH